MTLRYESIKRNIPEFLKFFDDNNAEGWTNKKNVLANDLGIKTENNPIEITKIYSIHIDQSQNKLYVLPGDNLRNKIFLNELFSMGIRGITTTFLNKKNMLSGYVPSFDCPEFYDTRQKIINNISSNIENVSGNLDDACN